MHASMTQRGYLNNAHRVLRLLLGAGLIAMVFANLPIQVVAFAALVSIPVVISAMIGWCPGCAAFEALASRVSRKARNVLNRHSFA